MVYSIALHCIWISWFSRFFNVSNPEEVKNGGKPDLKEVGPYAYLEVRRKENIFEIDTDKIQFGQYYEYHFNQTETDKECDGCSADDEITVLNGALMAVVGLLQQNKVNGSTTFG